MRIQTARVLILVAAVLSVLAGCAAAPEFTDAVAPDQTAQNAPSADVTGSIPLPPARPGALQAELPPPPAAAPYILLGVGF